jgi:predicted RecB family nuclease
MIAEHPGIRFVHWANYENDMVSRYLERFGDDAAGTGATVLASLLDLLPVAKQTVAVPLPSYSLKLVENLAAFKRSDGDVGKGDDSIVAYTTARGSDDPVMQAEIIESIRAYNEEDLAATWAVQEWLVRLGDDGS